MNPKVILLIEFSNGGHKEAFMQFFVKALLELGHEVICVMPDTTAVKKWVANNTNISSAHFFDLPTPQKTVKKFGRFNQAVSTILLWRNQTKKVKYIEQQIGKKTDLVYFNWLDSLMANYLPSSFVDLIFPYKWSGLYFHPVIFRQRPQYLKSSATARDVDAVFLSKNCIGITMHDEGILEIYGKRIKKTTLLFPEIADGTPPNPNHILANKIKKQANGRTIVGIIGLEPHKGISSLVRIAKVANPQQFFFAFTGLFYEELYDNITEEKRNDILDFKNNLPENCIWETGSLTEGEDYNSVFCSFDIIHIIYKEFYSSSNRLTKAAIFNKLVLGCNYGCVGEDIPKYNLGAVADEEDTTEQYQKLQELRMRILQKDFPYDNWTIYQNKHSVEILPNKFEELLNLL